MHFDRLLGGCLSTFIILSTLYVLYLAALHPKDFENLMSKNRTFVGRAWDFVLLITACVGCGWCIYSGLVRLFWFIPRDWGGYDDDGVWSWTGSSLAGVGAIAGTFLCASSLAKLVEAQIKAREYEQLLYGSKKNQRN